MGRRENLKKNSLVRQLFLRRRANCSYCTRPLNDRCGDVVFFFTVKLLYILGLNCNSRRKTSRAVHLRVRFLQPAPVHQRSHFRFRLHNFLHRLDFLVKEEKSQRPTLEGIKTRLSVLVQIDITITVVEARFFLLLPTGSCGILVG